MRCMTTNRDSMRSMIRDMSGLHQSAQLGVYATKQRHAHQGGNILDIWSTIYSIRINSASKMPQARKRMPKQLYRADLVHEVHS